MLPLSRVSLYTAALIAGAFGSFLIISPIDALFVAPQVPQTPPNGLLGRFQRPHRSIPAQAPQSRLQGAPGAQYANGLLTGP